jgi:hypothetical protein
MKWAGFAKLMGNVFGEKSYRSFYV